MTIPRLLGVCLAILFTVVVETSAQASQQRPAQSDQEILVNLERRWNEAFYRRDAAFIATSLADDFVATYDDGSRGDKAKELALVSTFAQQAARAASTRT